MPEPVALLAARDHGPGLTGNVYAALDAAITVKPGWQVLVKPNLLMAHGLSCSSPQVVAAACQWLLDHGCKVAVSDSPAFGSCEYVADAIGLSPLLYPLGLRARGFQACKKLKLPVQGEPVIGVGAEALEADLILSIPRVKAHSQMRLTLSVKNCYGCIMGMRKAICHARFGISVDYFADCVAALWESLPPVAALCDGITAMNITGPRKGRPYNLGLLGASMSAPALDAAIMAILGVESTPLSEALKRRGVDFGAVFPLGNISDFHAPGFETPKMLKEISFNPLMLAKSLIKRFWEDRKK